jgi:hypothetical protein
MKGYIKPGAEAVIDHAALFIYPVILTYIFLYRGNGVSVKPFAYGDFSHQYLTLLRELILSMFLIDRFGLVDRM